jgi:glyoxylase-like metal-dependent hydrolase (beta-lactamase superfamily II)
MKQFIHSENANSYIWCHKKKCLLIDPSESLIDIKDYLSDKELIAIVLTHAHADHMHLIGVFDTDIYLHPEDMRLLDYPKHIGYPKGFPFQLSKLKLKPMPQSFILADKTIDVIHTPGHSPGSVTLTDGVSMVSGDVIFRESVGRTDLYLGNESHLKQSVIKLMAYSNDCVIYPGHGLKTTVREEKSHNVFVKRWLK